MATPGGGAESAVYDCLVCSRWQLRGHVIVAGGQPEYRCQAPTGVLINETMGQLPGPVDNESWSSSSSSSSVRCEVYVGNNETERCTDWQYYGDVGHTIVSQVRLPPASAPETCVGFSFQWEREREYANDGNDGKSRLRVTTGIGPATFSWLDSRVVCVLDSGAEGPGFKSQPRRCRVTVLGKLFTPIVLLFTKQRNCQHPS